MTFLKRPVTYMSNIKQSVIETFLSLNVFIASSTSSVIKIFGSENDRKIKSVATTVEKINSFDKDFTLSSFIDGAEYAYGFILSAFWEGNCKTLGNHLSRDVLGEFEGVINDMKGAGQTFDNVLNDIEKIELNDASINGTMAEITIKFNSHMTVVIKNKDGSVAHGDPEKVLSVVDIWTFCRDVARGDPNWTLVATSNE